LGAPWYGRDDEKLVRFRNRNRNQTFTLGKGLPGRVWQTKNPVWIGDLSLDSNFPRHSLAMDAHLKSALGVPVIAENKSKLGKKDVIAVLEFFQTETQERDEQVIRSVSSIALQLGLFIQKKQMEQVVRESEARFRIMADSTPAIIWITDVNDQVVYLNKQWVNHTGRSVEEVQGTTWWESVHPDDIEACYQRCRAAKEKRSDFFMEFRLKRADGIYRWMLDTATPRFDAEDRYIGYIGSMLDITELKLTEEKLKESELLFRSMAEASTQLIWLSDPEGRISYCNQAALEFSGKTLEEIRSFGFDQFIHPDDLQGLLQIRTGAIQSRTHYHYECRLLRKDGVYCWALIGAAPRFIGDGLYQGFVGSAIDITERKLAEEKLKESELRFRSMANSSPFMIIISDNSTGCFHFNQAWRDFTGLDYQSFCGRNWFNQVVHREDRASLISKYLKALRKGQVIEAEFRVRRYDGQYRWVYGAASPRVNDKENLFGFVGSWMDITERKQYREELEHTVEKRTAELEAVNRELESFSYSVSHDLRAPLRGIDGMSKVVLKNYQDKLDEKGVKYLEILRKEAQRMGDLINEMLSLSRLTRGELHWNTVDLSAIANEVANSLKQQEPGRIVNFKIKPGIIVQGDPHLLTAVMDNLLGNAWKFTSKHPEATIQFGSRKKDNQTVYFVKDDGAGFDMAYADQLFGAFQRLHTIEEFPGTGIGLATVQRIIHRHGGKVWAKGKVEKGAQIYFTLGEQHESIH
jgi:PAS domain S-box-containing protein